MGAGIVEVDGLGFLDTLTFTKCHLKADAFLAKLFAFDCTLQLIQQKGSAERHFQIYTDNQLVHKLFTKELDDISNDLYIDNLKKQVSLLKKFTKFELQLKNQNIEQFAKMAHLLSREYMDNPTTSIYP